MPPWPQILGHPSAAAHSRSSSAVTSSDTQPPATSSSTTTSTTTNSNSTLFSPNPRLFPGARPSPHYRSKSHNIPHVTPPPPHPPLQQSRPLLRSTAPSLQRIEGDLIAAVEANADWSLDSPWPSGRRAVMANPHASVELTSGHCMCCDSTVRWPSNLSNFRCTICMTVNDLKSAKPPTDTPLRKPPPPPMSLAIVREIIDVSVDFFLAERMSEELSPPIPSSFLPASISVPSFDDPTVPPSRPPPPLPPVGGQGSKIPLSRQDIAINKEKLWAAKLFKSLEEYIKVSFSSWECLNASFVDSSAAPALGINTQAEEAVQPPKDTGEVFIPVTEKPGEKEALMLTVGRAARRERANSRNGRGSKTHELRPTFRPPPCIDWDLAQLFYDVVLNAGEDALERLEILEPQSAQRRTQLKYAIEEARIDMLKVLLKTTESILKRPGRPLRRPEDIRFLLVILANPLLYPGGPRLTSSRPLLSPVESPQIPKPTIRKVSSPGKDMSMGGPGYHSGILKRLFGLLSNLPNECHHFLITWLTIMPERHFRPLAELGGSFTTYRISRHDTGKSVRSSGMRGKLPYSDDWQIKATARVMSLLDKANNNSLGRRRHMRTQAPGESSNNVLAWRNEAYRRGQIIPGSSFYNMRLDYCDLIADFDVWESKVAKFCFCQYPFFLSMGAKIQILEHDARRQMEVQARNAFITNISNRTALSQYMLLKVRRECLVEDSLKGISESVGTMDDIKKGLRVEFVGEDGIDAGGLKKEWFLMVAREVFDPNHGLFLYDEDSRYSYFNPYSFESSEEFYLVGVLLGLAIYNSTILDVTLPPYVFRKLIYFAPQFNPKGINGNTTRPPFRRSLEDLAILRPALALGLQQLLDYDGDVQETFCRDFVASTERYGEIINTPLCPGGESRPVTNANRREFVDLYTKHLLDTCVTRQFEPFKRGFYMVCGGNALSLFGPEEIELLVRGSAEALDVSGLKAVAVYDGWGPSPERDPVVRWFWGFLERSTPEEQRLVLSFVTGSDRIPAMGATGLVIKVVCLGQDSERFPVARTCFNQICLWRYRKREKLERLLWRAVTESEGFGLK